MTCHGNCPYGQGVNTYAAIQLLKQAGNKTKSNTVVNEPSF